MTLAFVWLAASAGALSLLTPCVFPMVPITVSYFTSRAGAGGAGGAGGPIDRRAAWSQAAIFGAGIIATFTTVGVVLAAFVGAAGAAYLAANPWVNLLLTGLFVAFALNLFGVYQIAIPSGWLSALDRVVRQRGAGGRALGIVGALLMGFTFTLTSFTCTAPFVGTVLVTAASGHWQAPVVGMLVYSTVFALPFCVLALVPHTLARLPRAGEWMQNVKVVMGLIELAAAMKFVSNADLVWHWGVFTREVVLGAWVVSAVAAALYLWRQRLVAGEASAGPRALAVGLAAVAAIWLATGLSGRSLGEIESFLPPAPTTGPFALRGWSSPPVDLAWRLNDYQGALAAAKREGKRVFIDFSGYTCTNCRWMEANMFTRSDVQAQLGRFVLSRLFTDGEGNPYEQQQAFQQAQFNTVALPLYAVVDADGHTIASLPGLTRDPAAFIAFLDRAQTGNAR